jgi:hypothetical protein
VFAVACEMIRCGCTDDEIKAVLVDSRNGISEHVLERGKQDPEGYAQRQIDRARKKVGGERDDGHNLTPIAEPVRPELLGDCALNNKPELIVHSGDLPATARALRDLLATSGCLFDRDMPVKVVQPGGGGAMVAIPLTVNSVVVEAHRLCQPVKISNRREHIPITLPDRVARMYLDMVGEWSLPPLVGISPAPILTADGTIRDSVGYDSESGLWCGKVPSLDLPEHPRREDAAAALGLLRDAFKTFPFADSVRRYDPALVVEIVNLDQPPGRDESAFLVRLLTSVCRAALWLAPGFLVVAPQVSGAGSGKGLLVRAICAIAYGARPRAFTAGHERQELDKRIAAELVEAAPALFLLT